MERNLRRICNEGNSNISKHPKSFDDISREFENAVIMDQNGLNLRKTERFYVNTVQKNLYSFTLFASREIIKMIEQHVPEKRRYLMDGTFSVRPAGFSEQLLIIYIEYKNDVSVTYHIESFHRVTKQPSFFLFSLSEAFVSQSPFRSRIIM